MARLNLPDVDFLATDPAALEIAVVNRFKELSGIDLGIDDPRRAMIQAFVYAQTLMENKFEYARKQQMLAYASDDFLDHVGQQKYVSRLEEKAATTTILMTAETGRIVIVPAGFRVSVNSIDFTLDRETTVTDVGVQATFTCVIKGVAGNGYTPGQIANIVTPLAFLRSAVNVTTSDGGRDREDDDSYAQRIRDYAEAYTTAGAEGAYIYHTKSVDANIIDVVARRISASTVEIRPLMKTGLPSTEVLNAITARLTDKTIKPLTDLVTVLAPEVYNYTISLTYFIARENEQLAPTLRPNIEAAVQAYRDWQSAKLGRSIDPNELIARMRMEGAGRTTVTTPTFVSLQPYQIARCTNVSVTYGGVIDV